MRETVSFVHGKGRNSIPGPDVFTVQVLWVRVFWAERPGAMRRVVHAMRETASSVHGKGRNSIPVPDVFTVQVLWVRVCWAERPGAMRCVAHAVVHEGHSVMDVCTATARFLLCACKDGKEHFGHRPHVLPLQVFGGAAVVGERGACGSESAACLHLHSTVVIASIGESIALRYVSASAR